MVLMLWWTEWLEWEKFNAGHNHHVSKHVVPEYGAALPVRVPWHTPNTRWC